MTRIREPAGMLVREAALSEPESLPDDLDVSIKLRSALNGIGRNEDELFAHRATRGTDLPT